MSPKIFILLVAFGAVILSSCDSTHRKDREPQGTYVEGELIVKLKPDLSALVQKAGLQKQVQESFKAQSVKVLDRKSKFVHIKLKPNEKVFDAIERLKKQHNVEYAQPNYIYRSTYVPNDTHFGKLWGLRNIAQNITTVNPTEDALRPSNNPGISGMDIAADKAWDIATDCRDTVVAVLDSGVHLGHEDLINNLWVGPSGEKGFDTVDDDLEPWDLVSGHGTHVASTIAAEGNNAKGSTGVCWRAKIMPVRVMDNYGYGNTADIIEGIDLAVAHGAKVINMSLGGPGASEAEYEAVRDATNTLFVVGAGNDGEDNSVTDVYPCNFSKYVSNLICVGAVDQAFTLTDYSNYSSEFVQISAPGTNILGASPTVTVVDDFSGWVSDMDWGASGFKSYNPSNYDGISNLYNNNLSSSSYVTFDFSSVKSAFLKIDIKYALELGFDYLYLAADRSAGDIFNSPTPDFYQLGVWTGAGNIEKQLVDLSNVCAKQPVCTFGFRLETDSSVAKTGVRIESLMRIASYDNSDQYRIISGTSMATPHVAGVAALVWSYNPQYSIEDVKNAILNGGKPMAALSGKTSTGKVLNAMGSLAYISKPATPVVSVK